MWLRLFSQHDDFFHDDVISRVWCVWEWVRTNSHVNRRNWQIRKNGTKRLIQAFQIHRLCAVNRINWNFQWFQCKSSHLTCVTYLILEIKKHILWHLDGCCLQTSGVHCFFFRLLAPNFNSTDEKQKKKLRDCESTANFKLNYFTWKLHPICIDYLNQFKKSGYKKKPHENYWMSTRTMPKQELHKTWLSSPLDQILRKQNAKFKHHILFRRYLSE